MHGDAKVRCEQEGPIAVVRIDNPPVNTLSLDVRRQLIAVLTKSRASPACRAIILLGAGRGFIAGADLDELDAGVQAPDLWDLLQCLRDGRQPVFAAMHGFALGGGLAVALACDRRIATDTCMLGFPEVTLGLIPAFGATQYLTRIVGVETALDLATTGRRIDAVTALRVGLIDKVVASADLAAVARSLVQDTIAAGTQRQPMRLHPFDANSHSQDLALIGRTKNAVDKTRLDARAAVACADAVAAAITEDLQDGVVVEAALFADLVASPQSHELRRRFRAERSTR